MLPLRPPPANGNPQPNNMADVGGREQQQQPLPQQHQWQRTDQLFQGAHEFKFELISGCCGTCTIHCRLAELTSRLDRVVAAVEATAATAEAAEADSAGAERALAALRESDEPFDRRMLARFLDMALVGLVRMEGEAVSCEGQ